MEVAITVVILVAASYILFKNLKKKSSGGCDCGSCSSSGHCPHSSNNKKPVQ